MADRTNLRRVALAVAMTIACVSMCGASAVLAQGVPPVTDTAASSQGSLAFKGVQLTDSNLTDDELDKLLSKTMTMDETVAMFAKLNAAAVEVGEATFTSKGHLVTIRDLRASGVKNGKAERLSIGSLEARIAPDNSEPMRLRLGAIIIENGNLDGMLKGLKDGGATISRAAAGHVAFTGLEATFPDKSIASDAPGGNLYRIQLAAFDMKNVHDGALLKSAAIAIKTLRIDAPRSSKFSESLRLYGYDKAELDLKFSGRYEPDSKTYVLDEFTLGAADAGTVDVEGRFGNVDPAALGGDKDARAKAMAAADVSHFAIRITNAGYFEKALRLAAARLGKTPQALQAQWSASADQLLKGNLAADPAAKNVQDAIAAFVANPKSLTIAANAKSGAVKLSDLKDIKTLQGFLALVDITAMTGQ